MRESAGGLHGAREGGREVGREQRRDIYKPAVSVGHTFSQSLRPNLCERENEMEYVD